MSHLKDEPNTGVQGSLLMKIMPTRDVNESNYNNNRIGEAIKVETSRCLRRGSNKCLQSLSWWSDVYDLADVLKTCCSQER